MHQLEKREAASDAAILEDAIEVLRLRFGVLTAGDLISGLTGAAASIRARGGIIRAAEPEPEPEPESTLTIYDTMDYQ
jgi:hypothetical protein